MGVANPDIIIIGAGPCAMSAAFPLVEAGMKVVMLDAGEEETISPASSEPVFQARSGQSQNWRWLLGKNGLAHDEQVSPKLRIHETPPLRAAYQHAQGLHCENFVANGRYGVGGLSRYWGASTPALTAQELEALGMPAQEMMQSYTRVMRRIGVSGEPQEAYEDALMPPLRLDPSSEQLLERYQRQKSALRIGKPWQAVLSRDHQGRRACNYSGACLWGCAQQSIYDAAYELKHLQASAHFTFLANHKVTRIARQGTGYTLTIETPGNPVTTLAAPKIILAGGVITSTRLTLDALGHYDAPIRIEHTPAFAIVSLDPRRLGAAIPKEFFALSQLHMAYPLEGNDYAWGALYNAYGLAASDLIANLGLTMAGARRIVCQLMPALSIAFFYLAGRYSDNRLTLRKNGGHLSLHIRGDVSQDYAGQCKTAISGVKKELLRLGLIPLKTRLYPPGGDAHIGASLPMGQWTDGNGQLKALPGLYVADTASLPSMPAKHPTLTAMANADRIARMIAR